MTCMLDALKCMGLMVRVWEDVHHLDFFGMVVYAVVMRLRMLEISAHVFSVMVRSALLNLAQ